MLMYNNYIYIAVMALVSYTIRILPLTLIRGMDPHQIRKNGTWYYLRKTGSFHDNSGTQQSDSGN
mgnify:CR=1 FL=1